MIQPAINPKTGPTEQDDKGGCGNLQAAWLKFRGPVRSAQTTVQLNALLLFQQLFSVRSSCSSGHASLTYRDFERENLCYDAERISPYPRETDITITALGGQIAPNVVSKVRTKVNPLGPNPGLVIALHSPRALPETGLPMCPPEKGRQLDAIQSRAVHSLQFTLLTKYCETRACFAYFAAKGGAVSLQLDLLAERLGFEPSLPFVARR